MVLGDTKSQLLEWETNGRVRCQLSLSAGIQRNFFKFLTLFGLVSLSILEFGVLKSVYTD